MDLTATAWRGEEVQHEGSLYTLSEVSLGALV